MKRISLVFFLIIPFVCAMEKEVLSSKSSDEMWMKNPWYREVVGVFRKKAEKLKKWKGIFQEPEIPEISLGIERLLGFYTTGKKEVSIMRYISLIQKGLNCEVAVAENLGRQSLLVLQNYKKEISLEKRHMLLMLVHNWALANSYSLLKNAYKIFWNHSMNIENPSYKGEDKMLASEAFTDTIFATLLKEKGDVALIDGDSSYQSIVSLVGSSIRPLRMVLFKFIIDYCAVADDKKYDYTRIKKVSNTLFAFNLDELIGHGAGRLFYEHCKKKESTRGIQFLWKYLIEHEGEEKYLIEREKYRQLLEDSIYNFFNVVPKKTTNDINDSFKDFFNTLLSDMLTDSKISREQLRNFFSFFDQTGFASCLRDDIYQRIKQVNSG